MRQKSLWIQGKPNKGPSICARAAGQNGVNQFPQTNCVALSSRERSPARSNRACTRECHLIPRRGRTQWSSLTHSQSASQSVTWRFFKKGHLHLCSEWWTSGHLGYKASDLKKRKSYHVNIVLEQYDERKKTFLAFKDTPGNPLGRSPIRSELPWAQWLFDT